MKTRFVLLPALLLLLPLRGCAPVPPPEDPGSRAEAARIGSIRIVGSHPVNTRVVLAEEQGEVIGIQGPLTPELERLAGARVRVWGRRISPDPVTPYALEVEGYELLTIDGRGVVTGVITSVGSGTAILRTEEGVEIVLDPAPEGIAPGQKVWVQGPERIAVQRFGVIRP